MLDKYKIYSDDLDLSTVTWYLKECGAESHDATSSYSLQNQDRFLFHFLY
jgi:hypothetical protein